MKLSRTLREILVSVFKSSLKTNSVLVSPQTTNKLQKKSSKIPVNSSI